MYMFKLRRRVTSYGTPAHGQTKIAIHPPNLRPFIRTNGRVVRVSTIQVNSAHLVVNSPKILLLRLPLTHIASFMN